MLTRTQERMFSTVQNEMYKETAGSGYGSGLAVGADTTRFYYIQYSPHVFCTTIQPLIKPGMRVVDVGCGAGDKLLLFKKLEPTCRVYGIEYDNVMARFARYVAPFATVIEGDALQQDYGAYDLIYMYWPISNRYLQMELQKRVMRQMRKGAILVIKGQQFYPNLPNSKQQPDCREGWVKGARHNAKHT